jgi:hypothetical protein
MERRTFPNLKFPSRLVYSCRKRNGEGAAICEQLWVGGEIPRHAPNVLVMELTSVATNITLLYLFLH